MALILRSRATHRAFPRPISPVTFQNSSRTRIVHHYHWQKKDVELGATLIPRGRGSVSLSHFLILPGCVLAAGTLERHKVKLFSIRSVGGKDRSSHDKSSSTVLACSPTVAPGEDRSQLMKQLLRLFQNWIEQLWDAFLVSTRSAEIAIRMSPLILLAPAAAISAQVFGEEKNRLSELSWRYALYAMQRIGPVAVKFCQWIATRRDIFPPYICDRLSTLHDQGYPHSWSHTHRTLCEAFGFYEEKGLEIEELVGCGSAAQVYRGSLTTKDSDGVESKRAVAIKVLHPRFQEDVCRDLAFIQSIANFLHGLPIEHIRMLNLPRATKNFGTILKRQADLCEEASNLKQFRSNFYRNERDEEQSSIVFPQPIDFWTSSKALVEDYVCDGIPISDFLKDSSEECLRVRKELAGPLLRAFLKMVFIDNFVHGDLHPGNVLVRTTPVSVKETSSIWNIMKNVTSIGSEEEKLQHMKRSIVFLDAGIADSLSHNDQKNLQDLFRAVILNDGNRAGRLMVERAKYERCSQVEGGIDRFAQGVEDIVSEFHDRRKAGLTLGAVRIGGLLSRVLDLCRIHGVEIDPAMASVVISTLVLEGLGRSLEPNLNLIDFARPFVIGGGRV